MGKKNGEGARPKDTFKWVSVFQDYTAEMMSALNNLWKPRKRKSATPTWTAIPPLVYLSKSGTPVGDSQGKKESSEEYVPMNFSVVDKTVLTPQGRQDTKGINIPEKLEEKDPDFYMPDGQGSKLSESYQMFTNEQTPEGNPGVIVKLANLVGKYGTPFYLMDRKSGHLYVLDEKGYKKVPEKGLLYPSESMIIAGALEENRGNPFVIT